MLATASGARPDRHVGPRRRHRLRILSQTARRRGSSLRNQPRATPPPRTAPAALNSPDDWPDGSDVRIMPAEPGPGRPGPEPGTIPRD